MAYVTPVGQDDSDGRDGLLLAITAAENSATTPAALGARLTELGGSYVSSDALALHIASVEPPGLALLSDDGFGHLEPPPRVLSEDMNDIVVEAARRMSTCRSFDPKDDPLVARWRRDTRGVPLRLVISAPVISQGGIVGVVTMGTHDGALAGREASLLLFARAISGPLRRLTLMRDLRKIAAEADAMRQTERRLRVSVESFTHHVSHDLREPLRSLATLSSALLEGTESGGSDAREIAGRVQRLAQSIRLKVGRLEEMSRIGLADSPPVAIDARVLVEAAVREVSSPEFLTIEPAPAITVECDPPLLQRALVELLSNALANAASSRPRVSIGWRTEPAACIFFVTDNGQGIAPEMRKRIFDVFHRGPLGRDGSTSGVGLAIVHKIAELHAGRAWVEASSDAGTVMCLSVPRTQASTGLDRVTRSR